MTRCTRRTGSYPSKREQTRRSLHDRKLVGLGSKPDLRRRGSPVSGAAPAYRRSRPTADLGLPSHCRAAERKTLHSLSELLSVGDDTFGDRHRCARDVFQRSTNGCRILSGHCRASGYSSKQPLTSQPSLLNFLIRYTSFPSGQRPIGPDCVATKIGSRASISFHPGNVLFWASRIRFF